jgi:prepilin signal peptidase PulO-like enzyme (type II secretory pathway)
MLALLATELAILIVTDLEHMIIPDGVQVALLFTGIFYDIGRDAEWSAVFKSAALGLGLGLLLHYGYKAVRKKDGLGWADVKFFCVAGVWLPFASFVSFLFFAGIFGTLTGFVWRAQNRGAIFPFGPALAASLFLNVLFSNLLLRLL